MIQQGKGRSKQKVMEVQPEAPGNAGTSLPFFTNPVFNPRKHDML
jgi:hypothetical protein